MNLTTLAQAEAWLGVTSDSGGPVDQSTQRLIRSTSASILGFLDRSVLTSRTYTEIRDGTGSQSMILREWPATKISSVIVDNIVVPPGVEPGPSAAYCTPGFLFEQWNGTPPGRQCVLDLNGYYFPKGRQNVSVTYTAGYLVAGEAQTVPASPGPYQIDTAQLYGPWADDQGVVYASTGVALTAVSGAPAAAGQYQLSPTVPGRYIFNAADANAALLISYSFIPADVEMACLQGIQVTQSIGTRDPAVKSEKYGEIAWSYFQVGASASGAAGAAIMTPNITSILQPYRRVSRSA